MDPMLEAFVAESRDLLEAAGGCFLALEQEPDDPERLNELFRAMHTIKGSSGLFEIQPLTRVVHAAEDVLDVIREGGLKLDPAMTDLFLDAMDQVGIWLDDLESTGALGDGAQARGNELSERLRGLLGEGGGPAAAREEEPRAETAARVEPASGPAAEAPVEAPVEAPPWLEEVPEEALMELYHRAAAGSASPVALEYLPDEQCFFSGDDPVLTASRCPDRAWLGVDAREPWPGPEALDPYRCLLRLRLLSGAGAEAVREHFRYVPEEIELLPLPARALVLPRGEPGEPELYQEFAGMAPALIERGAWDELQAAIEPLLELGSPELYQSSALRWLRAVARAEEPDAGLAAALAQAVADGAFRLPEQATAGPAPAPGGTPPSGERPAGEARELLQAQLKLLSLHGESSSAPANLPAVGRVVRSLLAALGQEARLPRLEEALALPPDQAAERLSGLLLELLGGEPAAAEAAEPDAAVDLLRAQRDLLAQPLRPEVREGTLAATARVVRAALRALGRGGLLGRLDEAVEQARRDANAAPLRELIEAALDGPAAMARPGEKAAPQPVTRQREAARPPAGGNGSPGGGEPRKGNPVLKVDQARIDVLMDLVGELVVAKNALPYLARQAEEQFGTPPLAKAIKSQYAVINRIAEELQAAVMQVRMVPVSTVFQRFPRLVRDLSRKLDKKIRLVMEGEETEIDKNVVEDLPDPLVHLIRNSIDHGIEPPAQREAAGKPAEGTITLRASQLDDQVLIEICDDGKGIDPEVIKRKAYEKGLIDEERLDRISDQEALQLILAPGFSTAEQVTDLSGRGVGMDVVNSMVARVGGTVTVDSSPGRGSTIRLALPLSMAVTRVMMVDAGGDSFGVPMEAITETVKVPAGEIQRVKQRELVVLRNRLIPLLWLQQVLELERGKAPEADEVAVLVVRVEGQELGLVVDRFHAGMDVILKPLEGILSGFRHFSGTALLGDGRVLLVLNLMELQRCL